MNVSIKLRKFIEDKCTYPNFPKEGINFIDIFPLIRKFRFKDVEKLDIPEPIVLLPEARGFCFMGPLGANRCIPLRKSGKMPGELLEIPYTKEYGEDKLYLQLSALKSMASEFIPVDTPIPVAIFDDIIATGGSMRAIIDKVNSLKIDNYTFKVYNVYCYVELKDLNARELLQDVKVHSVYEY